MSSPVISRLWFLCGSFRSGLMAVVSKDSALTRLTKARTIHRPRLPTYDSHFYAFAHSFVSNPYVQRRIFEMWNGVQHDTKQFVEILLPAGSHCSVLSRI